MLDRDGTLIAERHYLGRPDEVELLVGVPDALRSLRRSGFGLVVLTNQSGVGRGFFDLAALERVHERMNELLLEHEVVLDGIYYCPHLPEDRCRCRKPADGLALRAAAELDFDPGEAFMVGDKTIDMMLGKAVGATTLLVLTGYGMEEAKSSNSYADHIVTDMREAAETIESILQRESLHNSRL
jgi:D-glycero-D-manno-heptose 1,7-bisphosphate phosphatase